MKMTGTVRVDFTTPAEKAGAPTPQAANLENYHWQSHCRGLFELPVAA